MLSRSESGFSSSISTVIFGYAVFITFEIMMQGVSEAFAPKQRCVWASPSTVAELTYCKGEKGEQIFTSKIEMLCCAGKHLAYLPNYIYAILSSLV